MFKAKKKISAREPIQQSSFTESWFTVQNYIRENGKLAGGIAVLIVAAIVVTYIYISNKRTESMEAGMELARAATLFDQQQYKLAIEGDRTRGIPSLREVADRYDGTAPGEIAAMLLGNCYLYTEQYDDAIAAYESAEPDGDVLQSGVLAGMGAAYEAKKEYLKAAEYFERASETFVDDQISADRLVQAGRNYAKAGNRVKAKEIFERVRDELKAPRYGPQELNRFIGELALD